VNYSKGKTNEIQTFIDLGYVVRSGDDEMIQHAKTSFYEDIMNAVKYDELFDMIDIVDATDATEADIPEFLLEEETI
jgi:hypothetical protein